MAAARGLPGWNAVVRWWARRRPLGRAGSPGRRHPLGIERLESRKLLSGTPLPGAWQKPSQTGAVVAVPRPQTGSGSGGGGEQPTPPPPAGAGEVQGVVFLDASQDGTRDAGEVGLAGRQVFADLNGNGVRDVTPTGTLHFPAGDLPKAILDFTTTSSFSGVAGLVGQILDVNVTVALTHTWVADLEAVLVGPGGVQVTLFSGVGADGDNFNNTLFDDEAATSITAGVAPFIGSYRPTEALSAFDGLSPNAVWELRVTDNFGQDQGSLTGFTVSITYGAGEPLAVTDASGTYTLSGLASGTYPIRLVTLPGWTATSPAVVNVVVPAGAGVDGVDFGQFAPALAGPTTTVEGITFDEDAANGGFFHIPPDPHGAVGLGHLVSIVNTSIEWHTKAGVQQMSQRLGRNSGGSVVGSFFEPLNPANGLFDPKVVYDPHADRFVAVALERVGSTSNDPGNAARLLLAVSDNGDPNGVWHFQAITARTILGGVDYWADYPGLAVDEEAIYLTANLFSFGANAYHSSRVWIVDKAALYAGGTGAVSVHDPAAAAGAVGGFTSMPARVYGPTPAGVGTFLVHGGLSTGDGNDVLAAIRVDNPLTAPTFTNTYLFFGNIHNTNVAYAGAPQPGSAVVINTGDWRVMDVVWRDNRLYVVNTVLPNEGSDAGQETVHWYVVDTTNLGALAILDQGDIGGEELGAGTRTFWPSLAVDALGNLLLGFAAAGPNVFAGAYYAGRLRTDPVGQTRVATPLAPGLDTYVRTFGSGRNRWGDYSAATIDPVDDSFWLFNEYALPRGTAFGGEDGRWGTRWGQVELTVDVGNRVWHDLNGNGVQDQDEPGLDGVTVRLFASLDAVIGNADDALVDTQVTVAGGAFLFADQRAGRYYYLELDPPAGFVRTLQEAGDDAADSDLGPGNRTPLFALDAASDELTRDLGLVGAPRVTGVFVRGGAWQPGYLDYLDATGRGHASLARLGYGVPGGSGQLATLPWLAANTLVVTFNTDVTVAAGDLTLLGSASTAAPPAASGFAYDAARRLATWTFAAALPLNKYLVVLSDAVLSAVGVALDGDWTTGTSTFALGSGDGAAGGRFEFRFDAVPGDIDNSGGVVFAEVAQTRLKIGRTTAAADYVFREDLDGSGGITFSEVAQARLRIGSSVGGLLDPAPPPPAPPSTAAASGDLLSEAGGLSTSAAISAPATASLWDDYLLLDAAYAVLGNSTRGTKK